MWATLGLEGPAIPLRRTATILPGQRAMRVHTPAYHHLLEAVVAKALAGSGFVKDRPNGLAGGCGARGAGGPLARRRRWRMARGKPRNGGPAGRRADGLLHSILESSAEYLIVTQELGMTDSKVKWQGA